ncbi:BON domain-containing protein [Phormidium sp. LEGE 05292]|uniref:BON domain-containing protein n=1 Tax=[Phormidium] sp. LEGE 05292 TaxID=767427 RepID=UPI0018811AD4|nr:BON domain-containing protein [Phormidium sp. LEGE 05292]MBE9228928.1 BON domain-containing protein [Phormidium sp. LEGE 05292]
MKKLTPFLLTGLLMFGAVACSDNEKTTQNAPDRTNQAQTQTPSAQNVQDAQNDAQSQTRRDQLNSDIRAREQRNNITGGDTDRAQSDLENEVRNKLEANIPRSELTIDAKNGAITVAGTVVDQKDLAKIAPLAQQIKGVKSVDVKATVAPAQAQPKNQ